ncbi:hypothetical protein EV715DRAFT_277507 [Schizophyllum commune]
MLPTRDSHAWETGGIVFSCDPEPPEARVRTPRAKDAKAKGPFTLTHPLRAGGCPHLGEYFRRPEPPEASVGSLGEISEGGGLIHPAQAAFRRRRGERIGMFCCYTRTPRVFCCNELLTLGFQVFFADPRPPEACARSLDEGRERGGVYPHYEMGIFADPQPPEACARSLGEGRGRGGVPLTPLFMNR